MMQKDTHKQESMFKDIIDKAINLADSTQTVKNKKLLITKNIELMKVASLKLYSERRSVEYERCFSTIENLRKQLTVL